MACSVTLLSASCFLELGCWSRGPREAQVRAWHRVDELVAACTRMNGYTTWQDMRSRHIVWWKWRNNVLDRAVLFSWYSDALMA